MSFKIASVLSNTPLIHVTSTKNRESIKKNGLVIGHKQSPLSKRKKIPEDENQLATALYLQLKCDGNYLLKASRILGDIDVWEVDGLLATQSKWDDTITHEGISQKKWRNSLMQHGSMSYERDIPVRCLKLVATIHVPN